MLHRAAFEEFATETSDTSSAFQNVDDGRAQLVHRTSQGRAAVIEARKAAAAIEPEWARLIGVSRLRDLRNVLEQLHDALLPRSAEE